MELGPNQRNEKIFYEGGHVKRNTKFMVHIINHIITGTGVYKDAILVVYKTLNLISKKDFHVLVHIVVKLRLNDA